MPNRSHINILHYQFPITFPYSESHPLTPIEANVLNHHRADLIKKIARKWVVDAQNSSPNQILSPEELTILTTKIRNLDASHQFVERPEPPQSQLEQHLTLVAMQEMKGRGLKTLADLEKIKMSQSVQQRARELMVAGTLSLSDLVS